jgi:hypothetical protein
VEDNGTLALRRARVREVREEVGLARLELDFLEGPLAGRRVPGVLYSALGPAPAAGEIVAVNTVGLEMGLGTGGIAIVLPSSGGETPANEDHFVKLPYTPLQFPASPARQVESLSRIPVVALPLHSHLAPACCAAASLRPGCRVAFVWQEGGALPVALSSTVRSLREKGLLHVVVSAGNCFGGDLEAPNVYAALLAAAGEDRPVDLVLAGIGPGVLGTASGYGHGGMSAAIALNAAVSLGADPILAPRLSAADPRERHRGVSHHTREALSATLAPCRVALPEKARGPVGLPERHSYVAVDYGAAGLEERYGLTFESMGRLYDDDEVFFDAAAAAVALALGAAA